MLGGFDLGLQVSRRVKVLALLPRAAALNVVHTHSDRVVVGVNHSAVCRVGKATVILPTRAVTPLILPTYLVHRNSQTNTRFITSLCESEALTKLHSQPASI